MKKLLFILIPLCLMLAACSRSPQPVRISRLDRAMAEYKDAPDSARLAIADSLSAEISAFFKALGHPDPGPAELDWWASGDEVAVFQPDVDKVFPDLSALESAVGHIYDRARKEGLSLDSMRFASIVYGQPRPLLRVDSVMLIALNHYLGSGYPGYSHWDAYRRAWKSPEALPYDLAAAIVSTSMPMSQGQAPTLLSNMLYEGALVEARMRLLPNPDLAKALSVTPDDLELLSSRLPDMWNELAEKKMIYDTNPLTSDRLLSGAPSSPLLNGSAPARAGRFIGYCIVKDYVKHNPSASLSFLLSEDFYGKSSSLPDSKFSPRSHVKN
ncbi:MAG: hypothetical protein NC102_07595 [Clostridium sp.]|nr:hypothetical protein [Clostridium sp.]